jgi:hypothetical protein
MLALEFSSAQRGVAVVRAVTMAMAGGDSASPQPNPKRKPSRPIEAIEPARRARIP